MEGKGSTRVPSRAEKLLFGTTLEKVPTLLPGIILAAALVAASIGIADFTNDFFGFDGLVSFVLVAIIVGMAVNHTVDLGARFEPGIGFVLVKVLRLGIVLLGIRLSVFDILTIGGFGVPIVIGTVTTGLVATTITTRWLSLPDRLGTLIAIGTGICGVTAIVASAPGIGAKDEEISYAVANITIFGIAAMIVYPFLGNTIFGGDPISTGLFLGTAIHETAQVAGAGLIYDQTFGISTSPSGADVAIVAKLMRNALMVFAIPSLSYMYEKRRQREEGTASGPEVSRSRYLIPAFIFGFLAMATFRSMGDAALQSGNDAFGIWDRVAWGHATTSIKDWAEYSLAMAMAGVGLGTSMTRLRSLGIKPFVVGLAAALGVGMVSVGLVLVLGPVIRI